MVSSRLRCAWVCVWNGLGFMGFRVLLVLEEEEEVEVGEKRTVCDQERA